MDPLPESPKDHTMLCFDPDEMTPAQRAQVKLAIGYEEDATQPACISDGLLRQRTLTMAEQAWERAGMTDGRNLDLRLRVAPLPSFRARVRSHIQKLWRF